MKYNQVKGILILTIFLCEFCFGIIRNDITDRCLHIRSMKEIKKDSTSSRWLPVYARTCTWDASVRNYKLRSHLDSHLEIMTGHAVDSIPNGDLTFIIRKIEEDLEAPSTTGGDMCTSDYQTCLSSEENKATASSGSNCTDNLPTTRFIIDVVPQTNFKGTLTSPVSFKIRNSQGNCLTVRPGNEALKFMECSSRHGLFQVWNVCRHTRQCDVGLMWTPRKITFPHSSNDSVSNSTASDQMNFTTTTEVPPSSIVTTPPTKVGQVDRIPSTTGSVVCPKPAPAPVIINEVLYTIQNALKIYHQSEVFLVSSLIVFYPKEVLSDAFDIAHEICRSERLKCSICQDKMKKSSSFTSLETTGLAETLIKYMDECNVGQNKKEFLSKDVLHVLLHLFPIHESYLRSLPQDEEKARLIISTLKSYLRVMEERISKEKKERIENKDGKIYSHPISTSAAPTIEESASTVQNEQTPSSGEILSESWGTPSKGNSGIHNIPLEFDIDVRLGAFGSNKNRSRTRK